MSEFRIEKRRALAELTLTSGPVVQGCFFLAGSRNNVTMKLPQALGA